MLAIGGLAVATGGLDVAQAEPIRTPATVPSPASSNSHSLFGSMGVAKGLRLTQTSIVIGSGTETTTALPTSVDATNGAVGFEFAYYTDTWFHQTEVEVTYHVEGTNEEVWIRFANRPVLDDLTEYQVRDATTHLKAPNPRIQIGYERTARENFSVSSR